MIAPALCSKTLLAPELLLARPPTPSGHGEPSAEGRLGDDLHQLRLDGARLYALPRKLRSPRATLGGRIGAPFAPIAPGNPFRMG